MSAGADMCSSTNGDADRSPAHDDRRFLLLGMCTALVARSSRRRCRCEAQIGVWARSLRVGHDTDTNIPVGVDPGISQKSRFKQIWKLDAFIVHLLDLFQETTAIHCEI